MTLFDPVLPITVQLKYDGVWNDITSDVNAEDDITITRGRSDLATEVEPSHCALRINNTDGKYSPRNPLSPLYGKIGRNTPIRVRVPSDNSGVKLTGVSGSYATTGDNAVLDITGDIDVRLEVIPDTWRPDTYQVLAAKYLESGTSRSWLLHLMSSGALEFSWSPDGTYASRQVRTSTAVVPDGSGRQAVRVTLDVSDSGNHVVRFYTAASIDETWTQLGSAVTTAGTTSIFATSANVSLGADHSGGAPIIPGAPFAGVVQRFELRNGIDGTVVTDPDFTSQEPGVTGFYDASGRHWVLIGSSIVDPGIRFLGAVKAWPSRWDGPDYVSVPIEAYGVVRRLGQGATPLRSAMHRGMTGGNFPTPKAYWPCEDSKDATSVASGLPGGLTMTASNVEMASYTGFDSSDAIPTIGEGYLFGGVKNYTATNYLRVMSLVNVPENGVSATARLMRVTTTGTAPDWEIMLDPDGNLQVIAYQPIPGGRTAIMTSGVGLFDINGRNVALGLYLVQSGANITWQCFVYRVDGTTTAMGNPPDLLNRTIGVARSVTIGASGDLGGVSAGHVIVLDTDEFWDMLSFVKGWSGETAADRISRLCAEEDVPLTVIGSPSDTELVGPQRIGTFYGLAQEAAYADLGTLSESVDSDGLVFRTRRDMYNQTARLALDYCDVGPPLEPADDDELTRNDVTVSRPGGSSAQEVLDTGPMSVLPPPDGVGRYTDSVTANVATDSQLADQAGWRLHLGTVDEDRYPSIHVALHAEGNEVLAEDIMALDLGDRVTIDNLPSWMPPDTAQQLMLGYTEVLNSFTWDWTANCVPASPWTAGVIEDPVLGHADTAGSKLVRDVASTATTLDVTTTDGPLWTTDAAAYPFDLRIAGETVTATACAGILSDTFTRTVASGWGTATSGQAWTTAGGSASDYSTDGTAGKMSLGTRNVTRQATVPLDSADSDVTVTVSPSVVATGSSGWIVAGMLARYQDASNYYTARAEFKETGVAGLSIYKIVGGTATFLGGVEPGTYSAAQQWRMRLQVIGTSVKAKLWPLASPEPGPWSLTATDTALTGRGDLGLTATLAASNTNTLPVVVTWDNLALATPQRFTVARSVNGVEKPQLAGADVRLAHPAVVAL